MDDSGACGVQRGPTRPPDTRYADWKAAHESLGDTAVRVTAVDFNGSDFDGGPFSATPEWLVSAVLAGRIRISVASGGTDYAVWDIETATGVVRAIPGDYISRDSGGALVVDEYPEEHRHPSRLPLTVMIAGFRMRAVSGATGYRAYDRDGRLVDEVRLPDGKSA